MDLDDILLNHPHDFFRFRELGINPNMCFVMMPFAGEFAIVYDTIQEALQGLMTCQRADDLRLGQPILERILRGIATAGLIIADLTNLNPNVFYELGIAHTRTKNVLLLTRNINDLPFDLRQLFCHTYSVDSREGLDRLKAVVRQAAENVLALQLPRSLPGSISRTKQIVQLMRQRLEGPSGPKDLVIRVQAAISSFGNVGRVDAEDATAAEYARLLEDERRLLIRLVQEGALLQAIISPQLLFAAETVVIEDRNQRLFRLLEFLKQRDECFSRCQFVISPSGGSNLLFFGTDVLFEGLKTGVERGFGWTAVYTDKEYVTARARVFDSLFESARAYTLQSRSTSSGGAPEGERLRRAVIRAVEAAVQTVPDRAGHRGDPHGR